MATFFNRLRNCSTNAKKTNLNLSIAHLATFILTLIITITSNLFRIETLIISLISTIIFALNIYQTFKNKKCKTTE